MELTLAQWKAKAAFLQRENERLRDQLLTANILSGAIRLEGVSDEEKADSGS